MLVDIISMILGAIVVFGIFLFLAYVVALFIVTVKFFIKGL